MSLETDERYMRDCFNLALKAEGRTSPNPIVGAVVVKDGKLISTGYHPQAGQPHAEVFALDKAGKSAQGATLYVSLEPCCHHGKTPPCTDKVIASGIKKVVAALEDPNPKVAGKGFEALRAAGIEVVSPLLEEEATWLNRAFIKKVRHELPWVVLKIAATLDGKIADRDGKSKWITGAYARQYVHTLRNRLDCVLIGAGTARQDNPELNVRDVEDSRNPKRAIVDANLSIDPKSRLCDPSTGGDTIIYCLEKALKREAGNFPGNVTLVATPASNSSTNGTEPALLDLDFVLKDLRSARSVSSILCEGGGILAGSLIRQDLVDEVLWIAAPAIFGDNAAKPGIIGEDPVAINEIKRFHFLGSTPLGDDTVIHLAKNSWKFRPCLHLPQFKP